MPVATSTETRDTPTSSSVTGIVISDQEYYDALTHQGRIHGGGEGAIAPRRLLSVKFWQVLFGCQLLPILGLML